MPGQLFTKAKLDELDPIQAAILAALAKKKKVRKPKLLKDKDGAIFAPELGILVAQASQKKPLFSNRVPGRSRAITR